MDESTFTPLEPENAAYPEVPEAAPVSSGDARAADSQYPATIVTPTADVSDSPAPAYAAPASEGENLAAVVAPVVSTEASGADANGGSNGATETVEKGISIIAREATVLGDIITEGHIDIIGKVRGNIAAQGDVAIHGQVRGNVDGEKIGLYNSRVKGNLKAGQGVIVNDASIIDGDVSTKNIIFDGKVRGSIEAESVVVLRSNSYCLGDVTAASIAVEPGAVINGTVRTLIEGDPEAPFEEII